MHQGHTKTMTTDWLWRLDFISFDRSARLLDGLPGLLVLLVLLVLVRILCLNLCA